MNPRPAAYETTALPGCATPRKEDTTFVHDHPDHPRRERRRRPARDAEIHFDDGPLAGLRLTGFALWRGHKGAVKVTLPSKTPDSDTGDFLKPTHPRGSAENLRTAIRQTYRNANAETPQ